MTDRLFILSLAKDGGGENRQGVERSLGFQPMSGPGILPDRWLGQAPTLPRRRQADLWRVSCG